MPYALVKDRLEEIAPQYHGELLEFMNFLIFRQKIAGQTGGVQKDDTAASTSAGRRAASSRRRTKSRPLGGFEGGFYMAPDFDEPLECFKDYM